MITNKDPIFLYIVVFMLLAKPKRLNFISPIAKKIMTDTIKKFK